MNEIGVAIVAGLLLSVSAGVRVTLPLLAVCLGAYHHLITLPPDMVWLGSETTLIILGVAAIAETLVHFIPAAGTFIKAAATPLTFVGGTLLMAIPLNHVNPLMHWTLAAVLGGGTATLTHLGVTGARAMTGPVNAASLGLFGLIWNLGEIFVSLGLAALGGLCVFLGWILGGVALLLLLALLIVVGVRAAGRAWEMKPI